MSDQEKVPMSLMLPKEWKEKLDTMAKDRFMSTGALVRAFISENLNKIEQESAK